MIFPDGVWAAETITVLDSQQEETNEKLRLPGISAVLSGITSFAVNGYYWPPPPLYFAQRFQIGLKWSLLAFGTGLLVGTRVALCIGLGTLIVWIAGPTILARDGVEIVNGGIAARDIAACDRLIGAGRLSAEQTAFMNESAAWEPGFAGEADVLFREKVEYEVQGIEEAVGENRTYAILRERRLWHGVTPATVGATGAVIGGAYDLAPLSGVIMGTGVAAATSSRPRAEPERRNQTENGQPPVSMRT